MRINVEERWWGDWRFREFQKLEAQHTGTMENVYEHCTGYMVVAWHVAQQYWCPDKKGIPPERWKTINRADRLMKADLAVTREDGSVYVRGTFEQNKWYFDALKAGRLGGRANAERLRRLKYGSGRKGLLKQPKPNLTPLDPDIQCNEIQYKEEKNTLSTGVDARVQSHPLVKIWNENRGPLPVVKSLSAKRNRSCRARWSERPSEEFWVGLVKYLSASKFHKGENDRSWRASLDFVLQPATAEKYEEGRLAGQTTCVKDMSEVREMLKAKFGDQP